MEPVQGRQVAGRNISICGETVPHPGHVCAFFSSAREKYNTLIPFFMDAMEAGDHLINIVDSALHPGHIATLRNAGVPVDDAVQRGQFELLTSEETYLYGERPDLSQLIAMLRTQLTRASAEQRCLRTCGEMNWAAKGKVPIEEVIAYEAQVNTLLPNFDCTLICVYDLAVTPSEMVSDIFATHPFAILNGRLRPNPFYVAHDDFLRMLWARKRDVN